MSDIEKYDERHEEYEKNMEVIRLTAKGKSPNEIAQLTGIPARIQKQIKAEFSTFVQSDSYAQRRAKETVAFLNTHFEQINRQLYDLLGEAENEGDLRLQKDILKQISDSEALKVKTMQQAGLISQNAMGDELAEMERRQSVLVDILKEVKTKYPEAAKYITMKLSEITHGGAR